MRKSENGLDEYRRFIGYMVLTFTSVFIYFPLIWFISLWRTQAGLYTRWATVSVLIVIFNFGFYHARIPEKWMQNLSIAAGVNVVILLIEYLLFLRVIA